MLRISLQCFAHHDNAIWNRKRKRWSGSKNDFCLDVLAFLLPLNIRGASLSDIYLNFLCICVL